MTHRLILLISQRDCGAEYLYNSAMHRSDEPVGYLARCMEAFPITSRLLVQVGYVKVNVTLRILDVEEDMDGFNKIQLEWIKLADGFVFCYHAQMMNSFVKMQKLVRALVKLKQSDRLPVVICELSGACKCKDKIVENGRIISVDDGQKFANSYGFELKFISFTHSCARYVPEMLFPYEKLLTEAPFVNQEMHSECSNEPRDMREKIEILMHAIMQEVLSLEQIKRMVKNRQATETRRQFELRDEPSTVSWSTIAKVMLVLLVACLLLLLISLIFSGPRKPSSIRYAKSSGTIFENGKEFDIINGKAVQRSLYVSELESHSNWFLDWQCNSSPATHRLISRANVGDSFLIDFIDFIEFIWQRLSRPFHFQIWLESNYCVQYRNDRHIN